MDGLKSTCTKGERGQTCIEGSRQENDKYLKRALLTWERKGIRKNLEGRDALMEHKRVTMERGRGTRTKKTGAKK